jgi:hypothetical protein
MLDVLLEGTAAIGGLVYSSRPSNVSPIKPQLCSCTQLKHFIALNLQAVAEISSDPAKKKMRKRVKSQRRKRTRKQCPRERRQGTLSALRLQPAKIRTRLLERQDYTGLVSAKKCFSSVVLVPGLANTSTCSA